MNYHASDSIAVSFADGRGSQDDADTHGPAAFVTHAPYPILASAASGEIVSMNPAATAWLRQSHCADMEDLLPGEHQALVNICLRDSLSPPDVEHTVAGRVLLWTYTPVPAMARVYLSARDVTENRRTQALLRESEARYRLLAEQSTDLISRHTPNDWTFIYASPAVETLLGFTPAEITGKSSYDLFHPDDAAAYRKRAPSVVYEKGIYTYTYRFRRKDGRYIWLETTSRSLRDPDTGELLEILCVSRDVTRRVESEQTTKRLARIVELTTDLVAFVDRDGRITYLNEAARKGLEIHLPSDTPLMLEHLFTPASYRTLRQQGLPAAARQGAWTGELSLGDGRRRREIPVSLVILAHRSATGRVKYFSTIARDMTASKQAEAQARHHQSEMAHVGRLVTMGEMASGLAHELNQPLAAIVNYAQGSIHRIDATPPASLTVLRDGFRRISRQARRAAEIIKRLRGFVRKGGLERDRIRINALLTDIARFCAPEARRFKIELHTHLDAASPVVHGDRVQIEQVVLNLLRNAMEASCPGSKTDAPSRVTLSSKRLQRGEVLVEVRDQGQGLPEGDSEKIFARFFTTKPHGIGLGLAISRSIIENHGGQLWAQPNPEGGACFSFTLPASPEERP